MPKFTHLHVHSEFSLLDGLARLEDLVTRTKELGMDSLAITDHGVMYAVVAFQRMARAHGIKPIFGIEMYIAPRRMTQKEAHKDANPYHLVLLAKNQTGYKNLLILSSHAHLYGFYYKPRVDKELLSEHCEGLIALSACGSGEVPRLVAEGQMDQARKAAAWYRDTFGLNNFFLELQSHVGVPELQKINSGLVSLASELGIGLVATNDVHYVRPEDAAAHDLLLCIQTNTTVNDPKRLRMEGGDYYLKSAAEMAALFPDLPEALENTIRIAESCNVQIETGVHHLPLFDVPEGHTPQSYLRMLCEEGLKRRFALITPELRARLDYELDVIHNMGFDTYFLIVWDLVRFARSRDIWCNVRGSGVSSIVSYCLGITNLNPLSNKLVFERFLNPGRITMPDIDLDFPDDRRQEMIDYAVQKYGQEQVAQIITFGTLGARAAIRDVGRTLGMPPGEVDQIAKLVPSGPKKKIKDGLDTVAELKQMYETVDYVRDLIDKAQSLEGIARHASTHAAGVVIADKPLIEYVPLQRAVRGDEVVAQFPMEDLEEIGLLKIDFLGLSTLTIMRRAVDLIAQRHNVNLTLESIPLDDPAIFDLLSSGDVTGVFQVEGGGMRKTLRELRPSNFEDVVALLSLYRPGPMQFIPQFIARKYGQEKISYRHPSLESILAETYGIIVYQEQIIRIATDIAGYTASEADLMRRAVGKKKEKELRRLRNTFVKGAVSRGISKDIADQIFSDIEFFANYGFNKAHSAAYAVITCQTAYLRAKYPIEYMTALLSVECGNTEKVGMLVAECRRMGIEVLPPDVNRSQMDFTIEEIPTPDKQQTTSAIRFGLKAIKNVGEGAVEAILKARTMGPFEDLDDFCRRVDLRVVNRRGLEFLIKSGAMDSFGPRSQLLALVERMMNISQSVHEAREAGQLSFVDIGLVQRNAASITAVPVKASPISQKQFLAWEKDLLGTYISEHPLQYLIRNPVSGLTSLDEIDVSMKGHLVKVGGVITRARTIPTKRGKPMSFVQIEDGRGSIEVVVFSGEHEKFKDMLQEDNLVLITGVVDDRNDQATLICKSVQMYPTMRQESESVGSQPCWIHVFLKCSDDPQQDISQMRQIYQLLLDENGTDRFSLHLMQGPRNVQLDFPNAKTHFTPELAATLTNILGPDAVKVERI
ncbi:MAG: DNA polymerase III subunit alpha [Chloroflexi bacterium]|nr:DNA polymerase III subunit alpha [Chloroflexota bacterium]